MGLVEKEGAFLTVCLKDIVKSEDKKIVHY